MLSETITAVSVLMVVTKIWNTWLFKYLFNNELLLESGGGRGGQGGRPGAGGFGTGAFGQGMYLHL